MTDCETVKAFLDAGGIIAVVFIFVLRDMVRVRANGKQVTAEVPPM